MAKKRCSVCYKRIPKRIKRLHFCSDYCEVAYYRVHHNLDLRTMDKWDKQKEISIRKIKYD